MREIRDIGGREREILEIERDMREFRHIGERERERERERNERDIIDIRDIGERERDWRDIRDTGERERERLERECLERY